MLPRDAIKYGFADIAALPDEPGVGDRTGSAISRPPVAVHHRQAVAEYVNPDKAGSFQNILAALAFIEAQPQQQEHTRAQGQGVPNKRLRQPERWIRNYGLDLAGPVWLDVQKVLHAVLALAVIDNVVLDDGVTGAAQYLADGTATAGRLQNRRW